MKTMRFELLGTKDEFLLVSKDKFYPALCKISNLRFHETKSVLQLNIDWINKGSYTNGQRKKLVARTIAKFLRNIIMREKYKLDTQGI